VSAPAATFVRPLVSEINRSNCAFSLLYRVKREWGGETERRSTVLPARLVSAASLDTKREITRSVSATAHRHHGSPHTDFPAPKEAVAVSPSNDR